jgi:hypothetical protein
VVTASKHCVYKRISEIITVEAILMCSILDKQLATDARLFKFAANPEDRTSGGPKLRW